MTDLSDRQTLASPLDGGFLQSIHWQKFQENVGKKTALVQNEQFSALMIYHNLPLVGGYFFVPRGPIIKVRNDFNSKILRIIDISKTRKANWIRIEPQSFADLKLIKSALQNLKIVKSKKDHEPAETLMLNLRNTEEKLLASMKPKTRYNINLAKKKGVEIYSLNDAKYVDEFLKLNKETAKRDKVTSHPDHYYKQMLATIPDKIVKLYLAKYQNKIISAAIVSFYKKIATYLHGASSSEHRNVMAPYGLQWRAIRDAKKMGCEKYDLGGTRLADFESKRKGKGSWYGITRFKQGYCPNCQPVRFPGCWDIILNDKKYHLYRIFQQISDFKNKLFFF